MTDTKQTDQGKDIDSLSGIETTGHEWDGIKELNNPMPRWWVLTFYATIVWALGYMVVYPAWPPRPTGTFSPASPRRRLRIFSPMPNWPASPAPVATPPSR
jgi:hypothetical protein